MAGPVVTGWALIGEFIFTLALALGVIHFSRAASSYRRHYSGLAEPHSVFHEAEANFEVILLLMFMVAGIYFMKDLLLFVFTKILLNVRSKKLLAFLFSIVAAVLSAFLDALTVTAVLISVGVGFYAVFHRVASGSELLDKSHDHTRDASVQSDLQEDLETFRAIPAEPAYARGSGNVHWVVSALS